MHLVGIFTKVEKMDGEILRYANTDSKIMSTLSPVVRNESLSNSPKWLYEN